MATNPITTPSQKVVSNPVVTPQSVLNPNDASYSIPATAAQINTAKQQQAAQVSPFTPGIVMPSLSNPQTTYQTAQSTGPTKVTPYVAPAQPAPQQYVSNDGGNTWVLPSSTTPSSSSASSATPTASTPTPTTSSQPQGTTPQSSTAPTSTSTTFTPLVPPQKAQTGLVSDSLTASINAASTPSSVYTSDASDAANDEMSSTLDTMQATSLASIPAYSDPTTEAYMQSLAAEAAQIASYVTNPDSDPQAQVLSQMQTSFAQSGQLNMANIQADADQQYQSAIQQNAQQVGEEKVAEATSGTLGSPLGIAQMATVYKNNAAALNTIKVSENDALSQAQINLQQGELGVAQQYAQLADTRRQQFNDLNDKQFATVQSIQQMAIQRSQLAMSLQNQYWSNKQNQQTDVQTQANAFAANNMDWSVLPDAFKQEAAQAYGSPAAAQSFYNGSLKDQQATSTEAFNTNTDNFYKTASQIPEGSNQTLYRPNPDGTFSKVDFSAGAILTENGEQYRLLTDNTDPKNPQQIKVDLGLAPSPNTSFLPGGDGSTLAVTRNADGSFTTKTIIDAAGNPVGVNNAIVSTNSYVQNSPGGNQSWQDINTSTGSGAFAAFKQGIVNEESGGSYSSIGKVTSSGDRAYGKYQVMGDNIASWTQQALGKPMTSAQFLADPKAQDATASYIMMQKFNKYGDWADVASAWFTGGSVAENSNKSDVNGTTTPDYVNNVMSGMQKALGSQTGPQLPTNNGLSYQLNTPVGSNVTAPTSSGVVTAVSQTGQFQDGSTMYSVTVKDPTTNTQHVINGIADPHVQVGQSWDNSTTPPSVGAAGSQGTTLEVQNANGTPIMPKGPDLATQVANGKTWGSLDFIPGTTQAQTSYQRIKTDLEKTGDLNAALSAMQGDPVLREVMPSVYMPSLQASANIGQQNASKVSLANQRTQQSIQNFKGRGINQVLREQGFSSDPTIQAYLKAQPIISQIDTANTTGVIPDQVALSALDMVDSLGGDTNQAINGQSYGDLLTTIQNKIAGKGGVISDQTKQAIVSYVKSLYNNYQSQYQDRIKFYNGQLQSQGYDPVLGDVSQAMSSFDALNDPSNPQNPDNQTAIQEDNSIQDDSGTTMNADGTFNVTP